MEELTLFLWPQGRLRRKAHPVSVASIAFHFGVVCSVEIFCFICALLFYTSSVAYYKTTLHCPILYFATILYYTVLHFSVRHLTSIIYSIVLYHSMLLHALLRLSSNLYDAILYYIELVHRASKSPTCGHSIFFGEESIVLLGFRRYFVDQKESIDVPQPSNDNRHL